MTVTYGNQTIMNGKDGIDGQDGKTPSVEQQPILDKDGKQVGVTIIVKDGDSKEVSRQDILNSSNTNITNITNIYIIITIRR